MPKSLFLFAGAVIGFGISHPSAARGEDSKTCDVVIYGGTSAAITAAVQTARMGRSVIVVSPDRHLGGLSSGGLGWTDSGRKEVIGGLSREFYRRVKKHYDNAEAWKWERPDELNAKRSGGRYDPQADALWVFEPRVAEAIFDGWIKEWKIPVVRDAWLDREKGVVMDGGRIESMATLDGRVYKGRIFIDATYEGDLLAAAGVSYHVGREANSVYGEEWNGIQVGTLHHSHWFKAPVDPYVVPGDPSSGLLPRISAEPPGIRGEGDHRIQAYCFRMCLTDAPENRIQFPKPAGYDPKQYELLLRVFDTGWRDAFKKFDSVPNRKTDTNNHGPFSTDNIGMNYDYPEASYARRREIIAEHETYQKGYMYFIANDPRVPEDVRSVMAEWGLPKDEFTDNGHWPHQLYIREARRMIGKFVMTEHELLKKKPTPDSVGMGSYTMDSHNVQRYVTPEGTVQNEGDIGVGTQGPYEIAYGAIVPKDDECRNLLVPAAVSSSHIAYGSIRMEPVFMILGQSAATAAVHAIEDGVAVQEVEYGKLRARLLADGQVLEAPEGLLMSPKGVAIASLQGIVVDDEAAIFQGGGWQGSTSHKMFIERGYRHDGKENKGSKSATFTVTLEKAGRYEVKISYPPNGNRAANVPVTVAHAGGEKLLKIDQRENKGDGHGFVSLGKFEFARGKASVTVSNEGTEGYVVVDAVQWLRVK